MTSCYKLKYRGPVPPESLPDLESRKNGSLDKKYV